MFSELRNERRRRIGDRAAADRLRDRNNAAGSGDNSTEISDGPAGIVDIAANVIPCYTPSWMEIGVTLFLDKKFQRGLFLTPLEVVSHQQSCSSLHSGQRLACDHFCDYIANPCGDIANPCGVINDFCGVIADACGIIADQCGVVTIPEAIGVHTVGDANCCATY